MAQKLVNLAALVGVALVACSFGAQPATALAAHGHLNRVEHHAIAAKKQRRSDTSNSKRCRKRPSSSLSLAQPTSLASGSASATDSVSVAVPTSSTKKSSSSSEAVPPASTATSLEQKSSSTPEPKPTPTSSSKKEDPTTSSKKEDPTTSSKKADPTTTNAPPPPTSTNAPPPPPPVTTHSTTSSSEAPKNTPPATGGGGSGKLLLSWPPGQTGLAPFITDDVVGMYSWRPEIIPEAFQYNIKTIPMLWGPAMEKDFMDVAEKNCKGGYMAFLNEPNQGGQANISPQDAAELYWRSAMQMQKKGYKMIAPATSSAPNGFDWVKDFFRICGSDCEFAAIALHYYGTSPQDMIDYIEKWHNQWPDKEVWVTEYACQNFNTANENNGQQCSESQTWNFHATVTKYMNEQSYIKAFSPFGVMRDMDGVNPLNQLMVPSTGKPTALGYTYLKMSFQ